LEKIMPKESKTPTPPAAPASAPKEKLLALTVTSSFSDGNLREFFEKYGYTVEWKVGEVRNIPLWLAQRCEQSGAEFEKADG
jgi:hypothetical protein